MAPTKIRDGLDRLTVGQIFKDATYRIPIYQRAYAWATPEIQTLLRDVREARLRSEEFGQDGRTADYYIGSVVVNALREDDEVVYEVIDGQQRLTTLFILLSVVPRLVNPEHNDSQTDLPRSLRFEGRDKSQQDLNRLARDGAGAIGLLETGGISHAVEIITNAVPRKPYAAVTAETSHSEIIFDDEDLDYLLHHVRIVRTQLPENTDLNHYFEVMNTRGEQLEKHEILKARMLKELQHEPAVQDVFARIWDATAQLNRHIQVQFATRNERSAIFGKDWDRFLPEDSAALFEALQHREVPSNSENTRYRDPDANSRTGTIKLIDLLEGAEDDCESESTSQEDEEPGSYGSIIDFPNFLLHVLKIQRGEEYRWSEEEDDDDVHAHQIRLEDKYLLEEFETVLPGAGAEWVRNFAWLLLRTRYLLDTYVIRIQLGLAGDDDENWVLHRAYKYTSDRTRQLSARSTFRLGSSPVGTTDQRASGRRVLMLQSMFQVTDTRRASKYFLFQALHWLHHNEHQSVDAEAFAQYLEASAVRRLRALKPEAVLNLGTQVPNFIFNFLDYVLWLRGKDKPHELAHLVTDPELVSVLRRYADGFSFRYRTSVEHFYPRSPDTVQLHEALAIADADHFGNLCIMSRSENSARSNLMPKAKIAQYRSTNQSLKFQVMAAITKELDASHDHWDVAHIHAHGTQMAELLHRIAAIPVSM